MTWVPTDHPRLVKPRGVADWLAGAVRKHILDAAQVGLRTLRQVLARFPRTGNEPTRQAKLETPAGLHSPAANDQRHAPAPPTSRPASGAMVNPPPAELLRADTRLPGSYGSDRIVLLARDPHCLYAYWDLSDEHCRDIRAQAGAHPLRTVLRIHDVTRLAFDAPPPAHFQDFAVAGDARSAYADLGQPAACFVAEIGYLRPDGAFFPLARSQPIWTPRAEQPGAAPGRLMTVAWREHTDGGEIVPLATTEADDVDIGRAEGVVAARQGPSSWSGQPPLVAQRSSWSLGSGGHPTAPSPSAARSEP